MLLDVWLSSTGGVGDKLLMMDVMQLGFLGGGELAIF